MENDYQRYVLLEVGSADTLLKRNLKWCCREIRSNVRSHNLILKGFGDFVSVDVDIDHV